MGSAVGKYAIYSGVHSDGEDAGHFNADAMLMADFGDLTQIGQISGMINNFVTASGDKDWMVTLGASRDQTDGTRFTGLATATGMFDGPTVWTIGDTPSNLPGSYNGRMYDLDSNGVPKEVGGTFYAPFEGGVGRMIGTFFGSSEVKPEE